MLGIPNFNLLNGIDRKQIRTLLLINSAGYLKLIERLINKHKLKSKDCYSEEAELSLMFIEHIPKEAYNFLQILKRKGRNFLSSRNKKTNNTDGVKI